MLLEQGSELWVFVVFFTSLVVGLNYFVIKHAVVLLIFTLRPKYLCIANYIKTFVLAPTREL